jgi:hypothetical protein
MRELKTPDFTPEAIVALVSTFLGDLYVLIGTSMPSEWKGSITGMATTLVLVAFLIHSAKIRSARAAAEAAKVVASANPANPEGYLPPE